MHFELSEIPQVSRGGVWFILCFDTPEVPAFPSYLLHDVDVNRSQRQRISIAFNATLNPKPKDNVIPMTDRSKDAKE